MSKKMVVLGAGIVGVSIAWHLQKAGYQVTLIDRKEPGNETSFGNAGLIQREAIRPYPFPRNLSKILKMIPNQQIDIRYQFAEVVTKAAPLFQYWHHSESGRHEAISSEYATLIDRCVDAHEEMIQLSQAERFISKRGYLEIYRTKQVFEQRCKELEGSLDGTGVEYNLLNGDELKEVEPAIKTPMAGGVHWKQVWSAQTPHDLVNAYFEHFVSLGGKFVQAEIQSLQRRSEGWAVQLADEELLFDQAVVALGPWAAQWVKPLGLQVPLFFKKGYHIHFADTGESQLKYPLVDAEVGYVMAPMPQGVRLCSGAYLAGLEAANRFDQLTQAEQQARSILDMGSTVDAEPWSGARPCLPDMKPIIGPAPGQKGLWLAIGHGHQGFTLGPITGRLIAQMIEGKETEINMTPFRANRF
ncbi:FAD-dependent oxidoreductase [Ferrimonas gelatinilytica]|uniref:FAD-dependent oxidoreductase n=1 Tax=Ferrimonas gelatinilytica TaxID=1255257 RepID=A0ABP9S071_9GAMM